MKYPHRVGPTGEFSTTGPRGQIMGNRGILHEPDGSPKVSRWAHPNWVSCTLNIKPGKKARPLAGPGQYTALFFYDEAVALAAGHRPCKSCRPEAFKDFIAAWAKVFNCPGVKVTEIDPVLQKARVESRSRAQITYVAAANTLPDYTFITLNGTPHLLLGDEAHPFTAEGYGPPCPRPGGDVTVLTPEPIVRVLAAGYLPAMSRAQDRAKWPHSA